MKGWHLKMKSKSCLICLPNRQRIYLPLQLLKSLAPPRRIHHLQKSHFKTHLLKIGSVFFFAISLKIMFQIVNLLNWGWKHPFCLTTSPFLNRMTIFYRVCSNIGLNIKIIVFDIIIWSLQLALFLYWSNESEYFSVVFAEVM